MTSEIDKDCENKENLSPVLEKNIEMIKESMKSNSNNNEVVKMTMEMPEKLLKKQSQESIISNIEEAKSIQKEEELESMHSKSSNDNNIGESHPSTSAMGTSTEGDDPHQSS